MERTPTLSVLWTRLKGKLNKSSVSPNEGAALPSRIFGQPQEFFDSFQIKEILTACALTNMATCRRTLAEIELADPVQALIITHIFRKHGHATAETIIDYLQAQYYVPPKPRKTAPPVVANIVECSICLEDKPPCSIYHGNLSRFCDHESKPICTQCIREHIATQLETQNWADLECIDCPQLLPPDLVLMYTERNAGRQYIKFLTAHRLRDHPNFVWCIGTNCNFGQIHTGGARNPKVKCKNCKELSCFRHRTAWHKGFTCDKIDSGLAQDMRNAASEATIIKVTKPCPNCGVPIQKDGGCQYMRCYHCRRDFTWEKPEEGSMPATAHFQESARIWAARAALEV